MDQEDLVRTLRRSVTRIARSFNQLMRSRMACGPITVQQCYTLEALTDGPLPMRALADRVGVHQSTLTRIVDKLERQGLITRLRPPGNRRIVEVRITVAGRDLHRVLDAAGDELIARLLNLVPGDRQESVVETLDLVSGLISPENAACKALLAEGCKLPTGAGGA